VITRAEILLIAPTGFTFICPLRNIAAKQQNQQQLPDDIECLINYNSASEWNKLHLLIWHKSVEKVS
jgi:hypothetical protein